MDLGLGYFTELDAGETARLILLLALLPFLGSVLVSIALGDRETVKGKLRTTWSKLPRLARPLLLLVAVPVLLLLVAIVVAQLWLVDDLLAAPWGIAPALTAIVLGTTLGVLATTRPRRRGLMTVTGSVLLGTVLVVVLFSRQFSTDEIPPASPEPSVTASPTGQPSTGPSTTPTASPSPTGGATDVDSAMIAGTAYAVAGEICVAGHGTTPVAIELNSDNSLVARKADGTQVDGAGVMDLLPCDRVSAGDAELRFAAGYTLEQLDGTSYLLTDITPVALSAVVLGEDGRQYGLVWRNEQGDLHVGLAPLDVLTK